MNDARPDDLVTLVVKSNEFAAGAVVAVLTEAGIDAIAFPAVNSLLPMNDRLAGVPVQVRRSDLQRAQRALNQNVADSVDLDWDSVDIGQRLDNVPLSSRKGMPMLARIGFGVAVLAVLAMLLTAIGVIAELLLGR